MKLSAFAIYTTVILLLWLPIIYNTFFNDKSVKKTKLTKRGRIVKRVVITALVIATIGWLFNVTTPNECKVDTEQLSQFCIDLLYP